MLGFEGIAGWSRDEEERVEELIRTKRVIITLFLPLPFDGQGKTAFVFILNYCSAMTLFIVVSPISLLPLVMFSENKLHLQIPKEIQHLIKVDFAPTGLVSPGSSL